MIIMGFAHWGKIVKLFHKYQQMEKNMKSKVLGSNNRSEKNWNFLVNSRKNCA